MGETLATSRPARASSPSARRILWGLLAVLIVQGALFVLYYHPEPKGLAGDEIMYLATAKRIAAGENPRLDPLWPPFYPRFLALLLVLGEGSLLPTQIAQLLLLALAALLLRDLARRILGPGPGANLSAFWLLAYPPAVAFAFYLWPEALHLFLMLAAFWIVVAHRRDLPWMPPLGLCLGLAFLTKSLLGPFLPILLAPVAADRKPGRGLARLAVALLFFAATLAPTLAYNHRRTGTPMVADSSLFNLWVGLNSRGTRGLEDDTSWREYLVYRKSGSSFAERERVLRDKLRTLLQERGPLPLLAAQLGRQHFRLWDRQSYLTAQLPGGPLHGPNRGYRTPAGLFPSAVRWVSFLSYALLLAAAAAGMVYLSPRRYPWLWLLLAFLAYQVVLFTFLQVNPRYRMQLLPVLLIYGGTFLGRLPREWRRWRKSARGRPLAALAAVALAWLLALGGSLASRPRADEASSFSPGPPFGSPAEAIGSGPWPNI